MIRCLATLSGSATPAALAGLAMLLLGACSFDDSPIEAAMPSMAEPPASGGMGGSSGASVSGGQTGEGSGGNGSGGNGGSGGGSGGSNAGSGGSGGEGDPNDPPVQSGSCANDGETARCFDGPEEAEGVGACHAGEQTCKDGKWSACEGQVEPTEETCDGVDNDCDGEVDEELTLGSCFPDGADDELAECATYRLACVDGEPTCAPTDETPVEQCNGEDDDCDGEVDEEPDTSCYVYLGAAEPGCRRVDGVYECRGICQAGARTCSDGRLTGTCEGQIIQGIGEACGDSPALDDDCDGAVDEGCPCEPGATQPCYTGPVGTRDVGRCEDGVQTCRSLLGLTGWGRCLEEAVPELEMCETVGEDDDCDGESDDVDVEGQTCGTGERGICAFGVARCEGSVTECERVRDPVAESCNGADDDCDGLSDEDYDLDSNRNRCGSCTNRCSTNQDCCDGGCADIYNDAQNCGGCGRSCAVGESCVNGQCDCADGSSYCNGTCRSASWFNNNNSHCGRCNSPCTGGQVCVGTTCQMP